MPYTPPSQRSPAASASTTPNLSRRSSHQPAHPVAPLLQSTRSELPRSTSYLTRHRRTPSVKTTSFTASSSTSEPTPPGTADSEDNDSNRIKTTNSLRQSPPPVTDDASIPSGAVLSPPDSVQNSSDEEDKARRRELSNLAELQAAIKNIRQHRESSPNRQAISVVKANQVLTLHMPSKVVDISPTPEEVERSLSQGPRKISHTRSNTDSSVFIDLRQDPSETPSEDEDSNEDEPERSRRKPMLRKKSGELVRPALRPSSSRRRPLSMPGTPTFSKAVHFDQHLEHVRHFLQVDRPLAVSAGSSPVESYESDTEFPFSDEDSQNPRGPPFQWEIVVSNFPAETPDRLRQPVRVERVFLSADNKTLVGSVAVANLAFHKTVVARFTLDYWKTTSEVLAEYNNDIRRKQQADGYDRFNFNIRLADQANLEAKTMFFCVKYAVNGVEYWDNNNSTNFQVDFRKKAKPQNGKKGMQPASARPATGLRSQKKSAPLPRPLSMPAMFDDFAEGFDSKYDFSAFAKKPVSDFLGEAGPVRLKGVKSAANINSDKQSRKPSSPSGQPFSNRYDFGASLSAAIQAANTALGDRSVISMKPSAKKPVGATPAPAASQTKDTPIPMVASPGGMDSPRPAGSEKPVLASQSYNELLDKYCFVRTH
jgi:Carbohydrate/starch-binding module (family 21)